MFLTQEQKNKVYKEMNPDGHNLKDCNFFKVINKTEEGLLIEVGYWITYLNCKPKYQREVRLFKI